MGRIIVIDGTSNAGKTTLCENIEKNINLYIEDNNLYSIESIKNSINLIEKIIKNN